ncbi:hypothetical protein Tco_1219492 [Tanacetum coccineum]
MSFGAMVKDFIREDLIELTMFDPPLNEDAIWSLPLQQKMYCTKALATPEQMATGKENSNPLIADSLLKTIRNGDHYGYNCPPKVPTISNLEPCHNQNIDEFPQTLPSFDLTCYYGDGSSFIYDSTPNFVNDSPNVFNPPTYSCEFCGNDAHYGYDCPPQIPIYYDDDDDEESSIPLRDIIISELTPCIAITPVLLTEEHVDSLIMEDKHLDTIPKTELDELIKSSVEDLVHTQSESDGISKSECDVPDCDDSQTTNFSTFSNPLFDDSTSSDDESSHEEIDSLFVEFAGELITIPPRIVNREHEEYISLMERLLYDNSSPRPPEDFHANPNTIIESLLTFPIPVEDSDSLREEIDIFPGLDDSIPSGIESDDYDSEGNDNSTALPEEFNLFMLIYPILGDSTFSDRNKIYDPGICIEVESTRFLAPLSPVIDTLLPFSSENEDKVFNHDVLAYKEKSPPSSSHRGLKAFQLSPESPMMIHGDNTPNLGVRHPHFYPP